MDKIKYKLLIFTALAFAITWICIMLLWLFTEVLSFEYKKWVILITAFDFLKSAGPSIVALILLKKHIFKKGGLRQYFFGKNSGLFRYILVLLIFMIQYFNFYLFNMNTDGIRISTFIITLIGQIMLGGGLEEAGWRGYLQPALEKKTSVIFAVLIVGIIWTVWHLPYFILPGNMHTDGNFLVYMFQAIITAFILTAIYKLTENVILCILFHGWQNTIVMTIPTNMNHPGFMIIFIGLGIISLVICIIIEKKERKKKNENC
jgi:membrane protease YdiL (CAAX protease family)